MRRMRMLLVLGGIFYFLFMSIPWALADGCPETELARILCPPPGGYIFVCQDHHGVVTVHHHCRIF